MSHISKEDLYGLGFCKSNLLNFEDGHNELFAYQKMYYLIHDDRESYFCNLYDYSNLKMEPLAVFELSALELIIKSGKTIADIKVEIAIDKHIHTKGIPTY